MTGAEDPVVAVETFCLDVAFKRRFALGSGVAGDRDRPGQVVFVKITTADGVVGWGEQRAVPTWSYETAETIQSVIDGRLAPLIIGRSVFDVEGFHRRASAALSPSVSNGFPFARAAVDIALHDAAGVTAGLPVHALLGGKLTDRIALCSAIGVDEPDVVAANVADSAQYHAYKIKIGGDVDADTAALTAAADAADGKPLWLDANQSYPPTALVRLLDRVAGLPGLTCIEQPVRSTDWAGLARVRHLVDLPVAVDEGSFTAADLARTATLGGADLVVIKICKAGGLRQALKTAAVAQAHGIEILASGLTDCGIGFAAALHVFAQLDLALPAELNGPELLPDLLADGLIITDAVATVPTEPGLGVRVDGDLMRRRATTTTRRTR